MNEPNKLECYITLDIKGFIVTNTLAYWEHSQVKKKMKWDFFVDFHTLHHCGTVAPPRERTV